MIHLRPSAAYMWSNCAAAPTFQERMPPEPESDEAREGTCAAWVADCVLRGDASACEDLIGRTHANGWLVTPDMAAHVQNYVDAVKKDGGLTTSEQFVRFNEFIAGTLDSATTCPDGILRVRDLKYGMMIVEVYENPQFIIYGAAEMMRLRSQGVAVNAVELIVYQPRAWHHLGPERVWRLTPDELWQHAVRIAEAGLRCQEPNPVATPGRHCRYCTAKLSCQAFIATTQTAVAFLQQSSAQRKMTARELADYWQFLELATRLVKNAKDAADSEAEGRMRAGENIPGLFMKPRAGNRKFKFTADTIRALTGVNPVKETLMSPAELEREGVPPGVVNSLSEQPALAPKVDRMPPGYFTKVFGS